MIRVATRPQLFQREHLGLPELAQRYPGVLAVEEKPEACVRLWGKPSPLRAVRISRRNGFRFTYRTIRNGARMLYGRAGEILSPANSIAVSPSSPSGLNMSITNSCGRIWCDAWFGV